MYGFFWQGDSIKLEDFTLEVYRSFLDSLCPRSELSSIFKLQWVFRTSFISLLLQSLTSNQMHNAAVKNGFISFPPANFFDGKWLSRSSILKLSKSQSGLNLIISAMLGRIQKSLCGALVCRGADDGGMSVDQMTEFINNKQRDPRLNEILYPPLRPAQTHTLMERYQHGKTQLEQGEATIPRSDF